ncbi:MAG: hypothetical protein ACD_9C00265G0002 [uncultured bacterium]|nr:MAG: hypothetical protein ACD_9C00265G0002 [uncultured bacterium]
MSISSNKNVWDKIKDFFLKYELKIVLFVGFCLISAISYEFGVLQGQKWQQKPLIIEKPSDMPEGQTDANLSNIEASEAKSLSISPTLEAKTATSTTASKCAFVGSKNSDKFYVPTCSYAKRVKPENLACYASEADAIAKGKIKSECK